MKKPILIYVVLLLPFDSTVNEIYAPQYSWTKFIIVVIFFTFALLFPILSSSFKVYFDMKDIEIKKRFRFYIMGVIISCLTIYDLLIYSTWDSDLYKTLSSVLIGIIAPFGFIFLYYGVVKTLNN